MSVLKLFILTVMLSIYSFSVCGETTSNIVYVIDLEEYSSNIDSGLALDVQETSKAVRDIVETIKRAIPQSEYYRLEAIIDTFEEKVQLGNTADTYKKFIGEEYKKQFSNEEIERLNKFYESSLFKKHKDFLKNSNHTFSEKEIASKQDVIRHAFVEMQSKSSELLDSLEHELLVNPPSE